MRHRRWRRRGRRRSAWPRRSTWSRPACGFSCPPNERAGAKLSGQIRLLWEREAGARQRARGGALRAGGERGRAALGLVGPEDLLLGLALEQRLELGAL